MAGTYCSNINIQNLAGSKTYDKYYQDYFKNQTTHFFC